MLFSVESRSLIESGLASFNIIRDGKAVSALDVFILELKKWNGRMNLTGLKDTESMIRELIYDALFLHRFVKAGNTLLDLGSGAGVLGIPLSILSEEMGVFSVDKSLRKIQFQRHIKRTLHLPRFVPLHNRIEEVNPLEVESLVVKAFGSIEKILEKGGPHVRRGGRAFILKGTREQGEGYPGFELNEIVPYRLPGNEKEYRLFVYKKV
jgi:16S rRNA (guanine527-N7)-methyltransferase